MNPRLCPDASNWFCLPSVNASARKKAALCSDGTYEIRMEFKSMARPQAQQCDDAPDASSMNDYAPKKYSVRRARRNGIEDLSDYRRSFRLLVGGESVKGTVIERRYGRGAVIAASVNLVLSYHFGQRNSCLKPARSPGEKANLDRRSSVQRHSEQASAPAVELLTNTEDECFRALNFPRPPFTKQNGPHYSHANEFAANSSRSTHFIMAERGLE